MRTLLELFRIIVILALLGALGWAILGSIYEGNETTASYSWLGGIAILLLLFVLYRNKLQFSGWYKGKGQEKLPTAAFLTLMVSSVLFMIIPFVLGYLFS